MKKCSKCREEKDEEEFNKCCQKYNMGGLHNYCRKCQKEYNSDPENKRRNNKVRRERYAKEDIKKKVKKYKKQYRERTDVKEKTKQYNKEYRSKLKNKNRRNEQCRERNKNDICYKLKNNIFKFIRRGLLRGGRANRDSSVSKCLPYTIEELIIYLESQFEFWMNWGNYGRYDKNRRTWQIDHIIPQSLLPYDSMDHPNFLKCWALSNLRPLEAMENMKKHNSIFGKITNCLVCGSNKLTEIINLGANSFADTFVKKENLERGLEIYLLSCNLCEECDNIQISLKTDPKKRYSSQWNEYSYTMSNSRISRDHWSEFAKSVLGKNKIDFNDLIVEIGSNDGFLLEQFNVSGYKNTLGIDPSEEMGNLAEKRGIKIVKQLFPFFDLKSQIIQKASIVVSNNTVNHSEDPVVFINSVNNIMKDDGIFVFETPWWFEGFKTYKFDCIYLEHQTYFTVKFCKNILEKCHMYIDDIEVVEYHGGSLRIFAKKRKNRENHCNKISDLIKLEEESGLFEVESYKKYMNFIKAQRNKFLQKIFDIKSNGGNIVGIGACAKGNTFLNFYRLDNTIVDYVTDSSPQKQGKFTPLSFIPIVSDDVLKQYKEVYCIILSWNLSNELKQNLSKINPNIIFIAPGIP